MADYTLTFDPWPDGWTEVTKILRSERPVWWREIHNQYVAHLISSMPHNTEVWANGGGHEGPNRVSMAYYYPDQNKVELM